jgi:hypothetical protein
MLYIKDMAFVAVIIIIIITATKSSLIKLIHSFINWNLEILFSQLPL